jgi:hypothetical protein
MRHKLSWLDTGLRFWRKEVMQRCIALVKGEMTGSGTSPFPAGMATPIYDAGRHAKKALKKRQRAVARLPSNSMAALTEAEVIRVYRSAVRRWPRQPRDYV